MAGRASGQARDLRRGLDRVLQVADGRLALPLVGSDVMDLPLHADLVTLSACDTALGSGYFADTPAGDEFLALNRAFLAAGSASVMATLWQVDDAASVSLMKQFYGRLRTSVVEGDAANALAQAQRALRRSPQLGHPYYWAAYIVVGQGGPQVAAAGKAPGRTS